MNALPPALDKLATLLSRLPGVGKRSAMRWAFHVLGQPSTYAESLSRALSELFEHVGFCERCFALAEDARCAVCQDGGREATVCVVESAQDVIAIEQTGSYHGLYHVLHGVLAPLKGIGPDKLRLDGFEARLRDVGATEVILATSTDVEGEATALYLGQRLAPTGIPVTRIATGIPMGGDLEYLDQSTLARALAGRRPLDP